MDRRIEKAGWPRSRWIALGAATFAVVAIAWAVSQRSGGSRLRVPADRLTTSRVEQATFLEYYPFDSTVEPATSVYLDIEGGGRVEEILVEGGQQVQKGDLILRFSNAQLRQGAINTETQLLYNLDIQRTTLFNRQQSTLLLRDSLLDMDQRILEQEKKFRRFEALMKGDNAALSVETFETTRDQLDYLRNKRALLAERIRREDELVKTQIEQVNRSIARLNAGLGMVNQIVESLDLRAPITGHLSTIDAQIGQNVPAGKRIGQIDLLDRLKLRAKIDQYYISRVDIGTRGQVNVDGRYWPVVVQKVYPEVNQNVFQADVAFDGETPPGLKRGQTLTVELSFGAPSPSLTVAKGGFYQQTGGRWVYLVAEDGRSAHRLPVRLGRQNPRQVEVLEGLREGDRIITSGYDSYNGVEELRFDAPLKESTR